MVRDNVVNIGIVASLEIARMSCFPSAWGMSVQDATHLQCHFFKLPAELKLAVIDYLETKRDVYNVSRTCKWLEDIALKQLYRTVDIHLEAEKSSAWSTGGYLRLRTHVFKAIQDLTIRDGLLDHTNPQYSKRRRSIADSPETYALRAIDQITENQLRSFSFMHRTAVSSQLFSLLHAKHGRSLHHLSCYEIGTVQLTPSTIPSRLRVLECRSTDDAEALGRLFEANKDTLQSITIGQERALVDRYHKLRTVFYDSIPPLLRDVQSIIKLSDIPNLKKMCLIGLDIRSIVPANIEQAMWLTNLEELVLESCLGSTEFLAAIAATFEFAQSETASELKRVPKLRKFLFRHEAVTVVLKEALVRFLNSFSGLSMLSTLFENGSMALRLTDIAPNHSATLQQLVLETRIQPRELLRLDTSRPLGIGGYTQQLWEEGLTDICRLCPNLQELSIGFPWNDEMVRLRQSPLPKLRNLHTMHIRNFPESSTLAQMGDYSIREHAAKFLDWTFGKVIGGEKPALEVLSIGPTLYETRFPGSNPARKQTPEFLRTHYFLVDWAQTRFKRWSAMLEPVSEKYMEEMRCENPLGGVFQQVWLK